MTAKIVKNARTMSDTGSGRSSPVPPVLSGFPAPIGLVDAGLEQDMLRQQVQQLQQQKQQDDTRLAAMEEALRRIQDDGKRYIQQRDAELDAAKHAAQAAITAAVGAAAGRLPEDGVDKVVGKAPKCELGKYDGTGDLDEWHKRTALLFLSLGTPPRQQVLSCYLNALKGSAYTHVDTFSVQEITSWSLDDLVSHLRARFELPVKQAEHREAFRALKMGTTETMENFYQRFQNTVKKLRPQPDEQALYWAWYFAMPSWIKDRLNMRSEEHYGTLTLRLAAAVNITRRSMAGVSVAYNDQREGPSAPVDPHTPTSMEINAMVKNGNGNGRGRSRGRSGRGNGNDGGTSNGNKSDGGTGKGKSGKNGKQQTSTGTSQPRSGQQSTTSANPNHDPNVCNKCGGTGHWARSCPQNDNNTHRKKGGR